MATSGQDSPRPTIPASDVPSTPLQPSPNLPPATSTSLKSITPPPTVSKQTSTAAESTPFTPPQSSHLSPLSSVQPEIVIPSYARWFSWNDIHNCEIRSLPEFFDGRSPSKNPSLYKYYRNSMIRAFRENPTLKITFTDVRKTIVGDVGSIRRVFDFLDEWGLLNYMGSAAKQPVKVEEKEKKSPLGGGGGGDASSQPSLLNGGTAPKKFCSGCKTLCTIACFSSDKFDLTLCARCYVRGNYQAGVTSDDFRRVEISDDAKTNWSDIETLRLLEAAMQYGDDWKKVAQHVGGRSIKDCVSHFIKLPFGEQFGRESEAEEANQLEWSSSQAESENTNQSLSNKRRRLTPLADASNPIMAQVAFLSALAGEEVAKAAAQAAITSLSDVECTTSSQSVGPVKDDADQQDSAAELDKRTLSADEIAAEAKSELEKEEPNVERAIPDIVGIQMKEMWEKIVRFEKLDLQMEKEFQKLQHMKNLLFADQLTLLFNRSAVARVGEQKGREKH